MTRTDLIAIARHILRTSDLSGRALLRTASDAVIDAAVEAGADELIEDDGAVDLIIEAARA